MPFCIEMFEKDKEVGTEHNLHCHLCKRYIYNVNFKFLKNTLIPTLLSFSLEIFDKLIFMSTMYTYYFYLKLYYYKIMRSLQSCFNCKLWLCWKLPETPRVLFWPWIAFGNPKSQNFDMMLIGQFESHNVNLIVSLITSGWSVISGRRH